MSISGAFKKIVFLAAALFGGHRSFAQIELSSGIDVVYPVLTNKYTSAVNYDQLGFGLHLGVSYKPAETQFFPTLNFGLGTTRLPLQQFGNNVATTHVNYKSLMLNGNFVGTFRNGNSIYFLGGIGFSYLNPTFPSISGPNGEVMHITVDSIINQSKILPAVGLGVEYVYGDAVNRNLYLSIGAYCQYVLLFPDRNTYYLAVVDTRRNVTNMHPNLAGNIFFNTAYISLHYLLGNEVIFWKHKD
jgi:hypothetical protein